MRKQLHSLSSYFGDRYLGKQAAWGRTSYLVSQTLAILKPKKGSYMKESTVTFHPENLSLLWMWNMCMVGYFLYLIMQNHSWWKTFAVAVSCWNLLENFHSCVIRAIPYWLALWKFSGKLSWYVANLQNPWKFSTKINLHYTAYQNNMTLWYFINMSTYVRVMPVLEQVFESVW